MEFVSEGSTGLAGYEPENLVLSKKVSYAELIHVWRAFRQLSHLGRVRERIKSAQSG